MRWNNRLNATRGGVFAAAAALVLVACPAVAPRQVTPHDALAETPTGAQNASHAQKEPTMIDDNTPCHVAVEPAGLKHRNEVMLESDRGQVSMAAHTLAGTSNRGEERSTPPFTFGALRSALASDNLFMRRSAALLLGRCHVDGHAGVLGGLVATSLDGETNPGVRVELAMSSVLRATHRAEGIAVLETIASGAPSAEACIAAAYLAQTGDPRPWPTVVAALDGGQPTLLRAEAVQALVAFTPINGAPVGRFGTVVDVDGLLRIALTDPEITVRQKAVAAVFDVRPPDAVALLEDISANDDAPGVRAVASHWLWHLRRALR